MQHHAFYNLFMDLLRKLFDSENQIIQQIPKVIQAASHQKLKDALSEHLDETKNQLLRLKKIFKLFNENPSGTTSHAMQGIFLELIEALGKNESPAVKDAHLIIACQRIEHNEMTNYGSARAIARHLNGMRINDQIDFDEVADLLQQSLDEENAADEKLTDIAEGGFFTSGINEEAEQEGKISR